MSRAALLIAVAYTAAIAIWTIGRLALGDLAQSTGLVAASALLVTQCIMSTIFTPWLACDSKPGLPTGLLPLLVTPWPLLLLVVEISGIPMISMVKSQIWVVGLLILSYFSTRAILRVLREGQLRTIALIVLQLTPATALWTGHNAWVSWLTS